MGTSSYSKRGNEAFEEIKNVVRVPREDRLAKHCAEITFSLLSCPDRLKGVIFRCTDNIGCAAHKFLLGVQSSYFRSILYKHGVMNIDENSLMNKMYRFGASSTCFKYIRQFFYTGCIQELEEATSLEPFMTDIDELITLALQPRKDHLGGVDAYLAKKLCEKRPEDIKVAMSRLCLGLHHSVPEIVSGMRQVIPTLEFDVDCFKVRDVSTEVVELVLRDIPLPANELDVCFAVHSWATAYFGCDFDDSGDLPEESASDNQLIIPTREDRRILKYIDLTCIKAEDIKTHILPMRLFEHGHIVSAQRKHSIQKTGTRETRVNRRRGYFDDSTGGDSGISSSTN